MNKLDLPKIYDIEFGNIDFKDYPDFVDAFISRAYIYDRELTEEELEYVNIDCREFLYEKLMDYLY